MMKLGFIGLGQMGKPMALNMLKSGAALTVVRRTDSFQEFVGSGARMTTDVHDVAASDIIFLCLPDSEAVEAVLTGHAGLLDSLGPGRIVVDFSTIKYSTTLEIAGRLAERGIDFIDAPVSGMEAGAKDGTLTVMCGGDPEVLDKVMPYLRCVGSTVLHMGGTGRGQLAKLINQLLLDINMAALAEVLPLAVKLGLDPEQIGQVVNSGTGRSFASEVFIPAILNDSFAAGYSLRRAYKDLVSGAELSANLGIPLPVLHAATVTYQMALLRGLGDLDKGAMICVYEELLGVKYRSR